MHALRQSARLQYVLEPESAALEAQEDPRQESCQDPGSGNVGKTTLHESASDSKETMISPEKCQASWSR